MSRLSLFVVFAAVLLISGCKKEPEVIQLTFNGTVTDPVSGLPVADAEVRLRSQELSNGVWSSSYRTIESGTTDGSGQFSFTYDNRSVIDYKLEVSKPLHFSTEYIINGDQVSPGVPYSGSFDLYKQAWYSVRLYNQNPFDDNDQLRYQKTSANGDCANCCGNSMLILSGQNIDTTITCPVYGGTMITYDWFVTKNSNINSFNDSIFATAFDTATVVIAY